MFTQKSHDHPGYRGIFNFSFSMISLAHFDDFVIMKMAARATAERARDSKHQSRHRRSKRAAGS